MSLAKYTLPDMRFEQSFMKTLRTYAVNSSKGESIAPGDEKAVEQLEQREVNSPIEPITPGIVTYAIVKDQILMPLLQGFLWTGILIMSKPVLRLVVQQGQKCGVYLSTILGMNQLGKYSVV